MSSGYQDPTVGPGDCLARAVQRAECGEHLCSFHGTEDEQRRLASAFVAGGLRSGERVLYVANEHKPEEIRRLLAKGGVDVDGPVDSGQLLVLDFAAVCGAPAEMDLDRALASYRGEADRSRADGYPGLRLAVEMGDLASALGGLEALAHWENVVGRAFDEAGITALCQYDRRLYDAAARARIIAEHAAVAVDDGTAPLATFSVMATPWGLRVAGELDLSTAPAFARALRARALVNSRVQVDLAALTFADLTGLRTVFAVARELPADSLLVLCRTPAHVRRILGLVGWLDPRVEVRPR